MCLRRILDRVALVDLDAHLAGLHRVKKVIRRGDKVRAPGRVRSEGRPRHEQRSLEGGEIERTKRILEVAQGRFARFGFRGSGAGGIRAIVDSGVVSYERLPMLEIVFDRMIRLLSTSLRNFFQDNVEVTLDNITSVRFGDYLNAIPLPTLLGVFRADAWENSGLVTVESNLAYSTLDLLLGGKRGGTSIRLDGRPFTPIEMQLVRRMVESRDNN